MIKLQKELFSGIASGPLGLALDRMFGRIFDRSNLIPFVVREFVDATSGAQSRYLPRITSSSSNDYQYIKIDVSANAVTIYPAGTDTIEGAASLALAAQYDWVILYPNNGVWYRNP